MNSFKYVQKVDVITTDKEVLYEEGSRYVTVFDPLDGSSNIDAGIPTGEFTVLQQSASSSVKVY